MTADPLTIILVAFVALLGVALVAVGIWAARAPKREPKPKGQTPGDRIVAQLDEDERRQHDE